MVKRISSSAIVSGLALLALSLLLFAGCQTMQPAVDKKAGKSIPEANAALDKALQDYEAMRYQQVVEEVQGFLSTWPNSDKVEDAQFILAQCFYALRDYPRTGQAAGDLLKNYPRSKRRDEAYVLLGNAYRGQHDDARAAPAYLEAFTTTSDALLRERLRGPTKRVIEGRIGSEDLKNLYKRYGKTEAAPWILFSLGTKEAEAEHGADATKFLQEYLDRFPSGESVSRARELLEQMKFARPGSLPETKGLKIGLIAPLTGKYSTYGKAVKAGVELALEGYNKDAREKAELRDMDSQGDPIEALKAARTLIEREGVVALIGDAVSMPTIAAAAVADAEKTPLISPTATEERISTIGPYIFQLNVGQENQATILANYAIKTRRLFEIAILEPSEPKALELGKAFSDEVLRLGGTIMSTEKYPPGTTDFKAYVARLKRTSPQAVFVPGTPDEVLMIAPQFAFHDMAVALLGTEGFNSQKVLDMGGEAVEGAVFTGYAGSTGASSREFESRYRAKFSEDPSLPAALGYDAAGLLLEAVKAGARDRNGIRDALKGFSDYEGATGKLDITTRSASKHVRILTIKNKQVVPLE